MEGGKEIKHKQEGWRGHLEILQNEYQYYTLYNNYRKPLISFFKLVSN